MEPIDSFEIVQYTPLPPDVGTPSDVTQIAKKSILPPNDQSEPLNKREVSIHSTPGSLQQIKQNLLALKKEFFKLDAMMSEAYSIPNARASEEKNYSDIEKKWEKKKESGKEEQEFSQLITLKLLIQQLTEYKSLLEKKLVRLEQKTGKEEKIGELKKEIASYEKKIIKHEEKKKILEKKIDKYQDLCNSLDDSIEKLDEQYNNILTEFYELKDCFVLNLQSQIEQLNNHPDRKFFHAEVISNILEPILKIPNHYLFKSYLTGYSEAFVNILDAYSTEKKPANELASELEKTAQIAATAPTLPPRKKVDSAAAPAPKSSWLLSGISNLNYSTVSSYVWPAQSSPVASIAPAISTEESNKMAVMQLGNLAQAIIELESYKTVGLFRFQPDPNVMKKLEEKWTEECRVNGVPTVENIKKIASEIETNAEDLDIALSVLMKRIVEKFPGVIDKKKTLPNSHEEAQIQDNQAREFVTGLINQNQYTKQLAIIKNVFVLMLVHRGHKEHKDFSNRPQSPEKLSIVFPLLGDIIKSIKENEYIQPEKSIQ